MQSSGHRRSGRGSGSRGVRKTFDYAIKKKRMSQSDLETMLEKQLSTTTSLEGAKDADLVIEAVLEKMDVKQDIWKKLEAICRPETVFATNTSALPLPKWHQYSRILANDRLHFFNPAHRMQLLEIICAEKTADQTLATSVAFARSIKKIPIVVNDAPDFTCPGNSAGSLADRSIWLPTVWMAVR